MAPATSYETPRPFLAWDGDEVVGSITAFPERLTVGERTIRAAWQGDTFVDPRYRGKKDAPLLKAFCTDPRVRKHLKAIGFIDTPSTPYFTFLAKDPALHEALSAIPWHAWHGDSDNELHSR